MGGWDATIEVQNRGVEVSDLILQTAKILPQVKQMPISGSGTAMAITFDPKTPDERTLGSLVAVFETTANQAETLLDTLASTLHDTYFRKQSSAPLGERFHTTIQALNEVLSRANVDPGTLHAVCMVVAEDDLMLSDCGAVQGYLIRNRRSVALTVEETVPSARFGSITSGNVHVGDQLVLLTPSLGQQIAETELKSIVTTTTPENGIQRIAALVVDGTMLNRVAAIIATVTTPDLLADQTLTPLADSIIVGRPESTLDQMAAAAAPVLRKGGSAVVKGGQDTKELMKNTVLPTASAAVQNVGEQSQKALGTRNGKRFAAIAAVLILAIIGGYIWQFSASRGVVSDTKSYQVAYQNYAKGVGSLSTHQQDAATVPLEKAVKTLRQLVRNPDVAAVNSRLSHQKSDAADPHNVATLLTRAQAALDAASGITRVQPVVETKLNAQIAKLALGGNTLGAVTSDGTITLIAGGKHISVTLPKAAGRPLSLAISDDGATAYVLTDTPSVWEIRASSGTSAAIELSNGSWPKGVALATYGGNLYILTENGLSKLVPTLAGFSAPQTAVSFEAYPELTRSPLLAIDGSVYLGSQNGPEQFTAGKPSGLIDKLPTAYRNSQMISSTGSELFLLDSGTHHIAKVAIGDTKISFDRQLNTGLSSVTAITTSNSMLYIASGQTIYRVPISN